MPQIVHILLVDDTPAVYRPLKLFAEKRWFENVVITVADTAEEAWKQMLQSTKFDCFIIDNNLGAGKMLDGVPVTGPELWKRFLAHDPYLPNAQNSPMPVAFHTGEEKGDLPPDTQDLIAVGRCVYIRKSQTDTPAKLREWIEQETKAVPIDKLPARKFA